MAKKDWDDFENKLKMALNKLASPQMLKQIGDKALDLVRERSTAGFGVQDTSDQIKPKKRFKRLSQPYIAQRARMAGKLSPRTSPEKSNVTLTGQMLDSMKSTVSTGKVTIDVSGNRRGKGAKSNKEVKGYVEEGGRPFNNLTTEDLKKLQTFVADVLKLLTKYL